MQASSVKIGWKVMLAMGIYLAVLGVLFLLAPHGALGEEFAAFTGSSWTDFTSANPKPSELLLVTAKEKGAFILSIGVLIIAIALTSYRKGERWSWYALLVSGIIGWSGGLIYHITIGIRQALTGGLIAIIGVIIFIIAIALPAKAILGKKAAGK